MHQMYRVHTPFLSVQIVGGERKFVAIPTGAVIEVEGPASLPGLVEITLYEQRALLHEQRVAAFLSDVTDRAEPFGETQPGVEGPTSSAP